MTLRIEIVVENDPDQSILELILKRLILKFIFILRNQIDLVAVIEPRKITLEIGSSCNIRCRIVNETKMDDLKFQWYKSNKITNQLEAITSKIIFVMESVHYIID